MRKSLPLVLVAILAAPALAADMPGLPTRVGQCARTTIAQVSERLGDASGPVAGSGSAVALANGGYQVSYEQVPAIDHSHKGDPARLCLVSLPANCPPGDARGKIYKTTNLRTHGSWTLPDSQHSCGGA